MDPEKETLYLVDGTSYVHRAYHAIRGLTSSQGQSTNAVFGFTRMLLKLMADKRPRYMVIVFDTKGPTFRHEIYGAYKANRPPMPKDLAEQLVPIKEIIRCLNVKMMEREGYEADDVIGTLARIGEEQGFQVLVVTGDKDFRQIITKDISLWDSMKDKVTDYSAFKREYGLEPRQVIEIMGLAGDSIDNIPGVPGVGEKTALDLIRQYGTMDNLFVHLDEIKKKKLKENLDRSRGDAILSRRLATIDRHVPLEESVEVLAIGEPHREGLVEIFRDLEFRSLEDQFAIRRAPAEKNYRLCLGEEELLTLVREMRGKGMVSVSMETTSEDPFRAKLMGVSFSGGENQAVYVPVAHGHAGAPQTIDTEGSLRTVKMILEDEKILKIGHDIKYTAMVFKLHGIALKGILFDTMIASYVIDPGQRQHHLVDLAQHYLDQKMITCQETTRKGRPAMDFSRADMEEAKACACEAAEICLKLKTVLERRLEADGNLDLFHNLEMKVLPVLTDMEMTGIKIDTGFFRAMAQNFAEQLREIEQEIYQEAGMVFNINSPQQLSFVLFEKLMLPTQKKTIKTRSYSTDVDVLKKLSILPYKIPGLLLRYRTLTKLKSTYLDALVKMVDPETDRIHTSFNQTVTATGRLSSSNPNLQNIPVRGEEGREIRKGFVADKGYLLLSADYSQIELRVFAHFSQDTAFMDAFRRGEDIHARTASEIFGVKMDHVTPDMRRTAKVINFGIIYGMGIQKLSDELGIDKNTAKRYMDAYLERYGGVIRYREEMIQKARETGYVTTLFNRRRYLSGIKDSSQRIRAEAERMAINTPIQGTAADLIKRAMICIYERLKRERLKTRMILQVHDELVLETWEDEVERVRPLVKDHMEGVYPLDIPLLVDIKVGRNWDEAH